MTRVRTGLAGMIFASLFFFSRFELAAILGKCKSPGNVGGCRFE